MNNCAKQKTLEKRQGALKADAGTYFHTGKGTMKSGTEGKGKLRGVEHDLPAGLIVFSKKRA